MHKTQMMAGSNYATKVLVGLQNSTLLSQCSHPFGMKKLCHYVSCSAFIWAANEIGHARPGMNEVDAFGVINGPPAPVERRSPKIIFG